MVKLKWVFLVSFSAHESDRLIGSPQLCKWKNRPWLLFNQKGEIELTTLFKIESLLRFCTFRPNFSCNCEHFLWHIFTIIKCLILFVKVTKPRKQGWDRSRQWTGLKRESNANFIKKSLEWKRTSDKWRKSLEFYYKLLLSWVLMTCFVVCAGVSRWW